MSKRIVKRTEAAILKDFQDVDNQLSPENLNCDGEITPSQARLREIVLKNQWRALELELGRQPTNAELYPELYKD